MVEPLRHRQTKEAETDMFYLKPPRHISTLPWLCKNAKTIEGDRRSYSSKTISALNRANGFNFESEIKNVILATFRSLAFLHSQGQKRR
jgi:hypothetical protein